MKDEDHEPFIPNERDAKAVGELEAERSGLSPFQVYRHPFILALIEEGVLPRGCCDFHLDFPLDGVASITASYFVDHDSFNRALARYQSCQQADRENPQS